MPELSRDVNRGDPDVARTGGKTKGKVMGGVSVRTSGKARSGACEETWLRILRFLAEGVLFEEVEYEVRESVEHEDSLEEVIYVGGKKLSLFPKKAREGARRALWAVLKPEEIIEEGLEIMFGEQGDPGREVEELMPMTQTHSLSPSPEGRRGKEKKGEVRRRRCLTRGGHQMVRQRSQQPLHKSSMLVGRETNWERGLTKDREGNTRSIRRQEWMRRRM